MSQVAIQNYMGRDYSVPFVANNDQSNIQTVMLRTGLNMVAGEAWDMIKNHPMVKQLLETPHKHCIVREKQVDGNETDNRFLTMRKTFNVGNETHKMLEIKDFRSVEQASKSHKKD